MAQPQNAAEPYQKVTVEQATDLIARGDVQVIDVRTPPEYQGGHIPVARSIPLDSVLSSPRAVLPEGQKILFVCQVGQRSAIAAEMAAAIGLKDLYNLEGGTEAWIKSGNEVTR
jgi:rhodanese-related sulfurtransferase